MPTIDELYKNRRMKATGDKTQIHDTRRNQTRIDIKQNLQVRLTECDPLAMVVLKKMSAAEGALTIVINLSWLLLFECATQFERRGHAFRYCCYFYNSLNRVVEVVTMTMAVFGYSSSACAAVLCCYIAHVFERTCLYMCHTTRW